MIYHKTVPADLLTPVSAFLRVAGEKEKAFLLESVEGGEKIGRYSFIGIDPDQGFRGSFRDFRESFPPVRQPYPDLPPFTGGAVGALTYEMIHEFEKIGNADGASKGRPSVLMDFYSTILAFDHLRHRIVIMSHEGHEKVREIESRLGNISVKEGGSLELERRVSVQPRPNFTAEEFHSAVLRAKEYIEAGDIFQVVLSQAFEIDFNGDPFRVYRALRFVNPSPYMFFLRQGDCSIVGSSPEMLVKVRGRELEYRPIAGTRRRGGDPHEEAELEQDLKNDEKECAEHLMLVDLGRNDLGRVCDYGQVRVEKLMFLEKYSHVMHLVSSLKGKLKSGLNRFDALAACFPAGTVTGAPKIRAMEIIRELEPAPRGIYAGAIGYIDYCGNLDTCIAIRTIIFTDGRASVQAGAGIVADSVPEREYMECHNKAKALVHALELALS